MELIGKDPEEGLTVQSDHDGEEAAQRAPHKHVVDNSPEACVESDLRNHTQTDTHKHAKNSTVNTQCWNKQQLNKEAAICEES